MVLDKTVDIEINGKNYKLCYPMKSVVRAERELFQNNLLITVAQGMNGLPPNLSDMYVIFKYGMIGGQPELEGREGMIEDLYYDALDKHGVLPVFQMGLDAVQKSGIMGDTSKKPTAALTAPAAAAEQDRGAASETPQS